MRFGARPVVAGGSGYWAEKIGEASMKSLLGGENRWNDYQAGICALALAVLMAASPAWAGQDQQQEQPSNPPDQNQPAAAAEPQQPAPPPEVAQPPEAPEPPQAGPQAPSPQEAPPPPRIVPAKLTLPVGTLVTVRVSDYLSSDRNHPGDIFNAELFQPLVVDGWVVARRGQTVLGRVAVAQKAGRIKGTSQLGVELSKLVLVDGQQVPVRSQLIANSGGTTRGRDAAAIGTTTGMGAIIGGAAGGGEGLGIGAGAGAAAGLAGVLLTRGRPTIIPPEAQLTFRLEAPLTVSTDRSRVAFRPVVPGDYQGGPMERRPPRLAGGPYPPRPRPYYP